MAAAADRDLCCCCIHLRHAVGAISLIYLIIIAATTYQKYVANNIGDQTAKIIVFISAGLQVFIALLGILSVITKAVSITKTYTILWWSLTLAVLALSIGNIILVAKDDKIAIEDACTSEAQQTGQDASNCYLTTVAVSATVLGIQFVVMCVIGWVNQRFLREVEQDAAVAAALKAVDEDEV